MKRTFIYLLRLAIVALAALPLLKPHVTARGRDRTPSTVTLLLSASDMAARPSFEGSARRKVRELAETDATFADTDLRIETRAWGRSGSHPAEDLEELGSLLASIEGPLVLVPRDAYWGPAASRFTALARQTAAVREKRLLVLPRSEVDGEAGGSSSWDASGSASTTPSSYLVLSELFLPKVSFLGEESVASAEIIGRLPPGTEAQAEIVLRSGSSLLTAHKVTLQADDKGVVHRTVQAPVNFVRAGTQTLTATLSSPEASAPLSTATTVVTVHHGKTTLLHIGVGPDWSLRAFRSKLKAWPNLDLLSYYILREATDDMSIPASQLSLIEFPAEKLFGSELPNFHGVIAQNFLFDSYLRENDTENLIRYVQDGGRFMFQAGPYTFRTREPRLAALFPCENEPTFDTEKDYAWKEGPARVTTDVDLAASLRALSSHSTATGCRPKKEALVLAETVEGGHPVVLAMPLGKGLVLSILSGDWHTQALAKDADSALERTRRIEKGQATDTFFQWVVEFLQRRQDGGLRAPDIASPRLYQDDRFVLLKSRGALRLDEPFSLEIGGRKEGEARPLVFPWLGLQALKLPGPQNSLATIDGGNDPLATGSADRIASAETRFVPVSLNMRLEGKDDPIARSLEWPLFPGSARRAETLPNPTLFAGLPQLAAAKASAPVEKARTASSLPVPLLAAYPWLLALLLFLLFLERLFVHVFGWTRAENSADATFHRTRETGEGNESRGGQTNARAQGQPGSVT